VPSEFFFSCWRALWVYRGRLPESKILGALWASSHGVNQRISKIGMLETIVLLPLSAVALFRIVLITGLPQGGLDRLDGQRGH
jgi:hypothetical protein